MKLNKNNLTHIVSKDLQLPAAKQFTYPERVLMFGTGVLLRGLPGYFIDKANRNGNFKGRILVVKSTANGNIDAFAEQDNLYTHCIRGIENGVSINEQSVNASISRVVSAADNWQTVLEAAHQKELEIIISNTTETGISFIEEDIFGSPPVSYPAKLLAFLYERFKYSKGHAKGGMTIVPTELISENGQKLKEILVELTKLSSLGDTFLNWLLNHNRFCNSLVDRIVPGKPGQLILDEFKAQFGYEDDLLIYSESYALWAIEGDAIVKGKLSFALNDSRVRIVKDITPYKELKLRLLNGTHSLCCGIAFISGFKTVKEAVEEKGFNAFVSQLMFEEILNSIPYPVGKEEASDFAESVLSRFSNPLLEHLWINISVQYTAKMRMRVVPCIAKYFERFNSVPDLIACGFSGYLRFMRVVQKKDGKYFGELKGSYYPIVDASAEYYFSLWQNYNVDEIVKLVLDNTDLWDQSLGIYPGFEAEVLTGLKELLKY